MKTLLSSCVSLLLAAGAARADTIPCSTAAVSTNCNANVPDPGTLRSTIVAFPGECPPDTPVEDVNVRIRLRHQFVGDLGIQLTGPSGKTALLAFRPLLQTTLPFGCPRQDVDARFSDQGDVDWGRCAGTIPAIRGTLQPLSKLAALNGESRVGTWTLDITDNARGDFGALEDWELELPCSFPAVSVVASDPTAHRTGNDPGAFTVTRTGPTEEALTLTYDLHGTASAADFQALPGTLTLPAGESAAVIMVNAVDTGVPGPAVSVVLDLTVHGEYRVDAPGSAAVTILGRQTLVSLTATPNPSSLGQETVLDAAVTGTGGTPTGPVEFLEAGVRLGQVALDGTGHARLTLASLDLGNHVLEAHYAGDGLHAESRSSPLDHGVTRALPVVALAATPNPAVPDQEVTLTATLTSTAALQGTVVFMDGALVLGESRVQDGTASWTTRSLGLGSHAVVAHFAGDVSNAPALSPAVTVVVNEAGTTTELVAAPNPVSVGQPVMLTATVTREQGTPTGQVAFTVDGQVLATVPVLGGKAQWSTASLAAGEHVLSAVFGTVTQAAASTSQAVRLTVNKASTTTVLEATPATVGEGEALSLLATVTAAGVVPNGSLTFKDGTTVLGIALLNQGRAVLTTSALAAGTHALTAEYAGGDNATSSVSSAVSVEVQAAPKDKGDDGCGCNQTGTPQSVDTPVLAGLALLGLAAWRRRRTPV